jgi:uncharacterized membrane protein
MVSDIGSPVRPLVAFWFLLICPGMAFVPLLRVKERLTEVTVAIALSIALDTIVSETMVLTKRWAPEWALFLLICMAVVGAVLQIATLPTREGEARDVR